MEEANRTYELKFFKLDEPFPFRHLPSGPTICLLVADRVDPPYHYDDLVTDFLAIGCRLFMTWGTAAAKFEDILDETLIGLSMKKDDDSLVGFLTSSHEDQSAEEVVSFMLKEMFLDEPVIRCCIGFRDGVSSAKEADLRRKIAKIVGN
jgi:hypothetical protein